MLSNGETIKKRNWLYALFKKKTGIKMCVYHRTDKGNVRTNNEDSYYVGENKHKSFFETEKIRGVFAVCDGMGGLEYGEVASKIAVRELSKFEKKYSSMKKATDEDIASAINEYASKANNEIIDKLAELSAKKGGSTVSGVVIRGKEMLVFNVGDSRVYLLRGRRLTQMTRDQTLAEKKLNANIYTKEDEAYKRESHVLTNFLGMDKEGCGIKAAVTKPVKLICGDSVIICTDGLYDMCSAEEIKEAANLKANPADELVLKALENGGGDNVSCIVLKIL